MRAGLVLLALVQVMPRVSLAQVLAPQTLVHEISEARSKVKEFRFMADWSKKSGRTVYLAGGTASGFAVYVKQFAEQELARSLGKALPYFESRFTWNYFDIYRSTQDADIVVDGTEEDATSLEAALSAEFPYLHGTKSDWEVRLLKAPRGVVGTSGFKEALIGRPTPDFQKQHSDSYSMGLIAVSGEGDAVVKDLSNWEERGDSQFLKDLAESKLSYFYRPEHRQTNRFRLGFNPEILSVIRALTKAFQYGADIRPESLKAMQKIVDQFNPRDEFDSYARNQIERNALKLFWHSKDLERSAKVLDSLGLRTKLKRLGGEVAVWLDRVPLPTRPLGQRGVRARDLKIDLVSHETQSFLAFENITFSPRGHANVFISRQGVSTEAAVYGDGFYTRKGGEGARGTGITVRFRVHPDARLGTDFLQEGEYVIIKNRAALDMIDETVDISPLQLLMGGQLPDQAKDRGSLEKFKLRLKAVGNYKLSSQELAELKRFVEADFASVKVPTGVPRVNACFSPAVESWFRSGIADFYPAVNQEIFAAMDLMCQIQMLNPRSHTVPRGVNAVYEINRISAFIEDEINNGTNWLSEAWFDLLKASANTPLAPELVPVFKAALKMKLRDASPVSLVKVLFRDNLSAYHGEFYSIIKASHPTDRIPILNALIDYPWTPAYPQVLEDYIAWSADAWVLQPYALKYCGTNALFPYARKMMLEANSMIRFDQLMSDLVHWENPELVAKLMAEYLAGPGRKDWLVSKREESAAKSAIHMLSRILENVDVAAAGLVNAPLFELVELLDAWPRLASYAPLAPFVDSHPEWLERWVSACELELKSFKGGEKICAELVRHVFASPGGSEYESVVNQRLGAALKSERHASLRELLIAQVFLGPYGSKWESRDRWLATLSPDAELSRELTRGMIQTYLELREDATYDPKWLDLLLRRGEVTTVLNDLFERYPALMKPEWVTTLFDRWMATWSRPSPEAAAEQFRRMKQVLASSYAYRGLDAGPVIVDWYDRLFRMMETQIRGKFKEVVTHILPLRPDLTDQRYTQLLYDVRLMLPRPDADLGFLYEQELQIGAPAKFVESMLIGQKVENGPVGLRLASMLQDHYYFRNSEIQRHIIRESVARFANPSATGTHVLAVFIESEWDGVLRDAQNLEAFLAAVQPMHAELVIRKLISHPLMNEQARSLGALSALLIQDGSDRWADGSVWKALALAAVRFPSFMSIFERHFTEWLGTTTYVDPDLYSTVFLEPAFFHRADWVLTAITRPAANDLARLDAALFSDLGSPWSVHPELLELTQSKRVLFEQLEWVLGIENDRGTASKIRKCVAYLRRQAA